MKFKDNLNKIFSDEKNGYSQRSLSKKAGMSVSMLHKLATGNIKNPSMETLVRIADVLEVSIDSLIGRERNYLENALRIDLPYNLVLFENIVHSCCLFIKNKDLQKVDYHTVITIIEEIYEYCLKNNDGKINKEFIEWFLEKSLIKI